MRCTVLLVVLSLTCPGCGPDGNDTGGGRPLRIEDVPPGTSLAVGTRSEAWRYPLGIGQVITTDHYRIYASADNAILMKVLPGFLEAAYAHYLDLTGLTDRGSDKPLEVYMLASRQEWVHLTRSIFGKDAPHLSIGAGGYCYKGVGVYWDLRNRATFSVAAHEGLHQFLYRQMRHRLPLSIEEGLCVNAEGFHIRQGANTVAFLQRHNPSRYVALRRAIVNRQWIPVHRLLRMTSADAIGQATEDTLAWYAQVWALSMFLRTSADYSEGFARMLADGQAGRFHTVIKVPPDAYARLMRRGGIYSQTIALPVFGHYITADLDTFERQYVAFARDLAALTDDRVR